MTDFLNRSYPNSPAPAALTLSPYLDESEQGGKYHHWKVTLSDCTMIIVHVSLTLSPTLCTSEKNAFNYHRWNLERIGEQSISVAVSDGKLRRITSIDGLKSNGDFLPCAITFDLTQP